MQSMYQLFSNQTLPARKYAFRVSIAVLLAILINYFFSFSKEYWMVLTTFCVCQARASIPFRQALIVLISIMIAMSVAMCLSIYLPLMRLPMLIIVVMVAYLMKDDIKVFSPNLFVICFVLIMLIASFTPNVSVNIFEKRIFDIFIGFLIGVFCNQFIFKMRLAKEFQEGLLPLLKTLANYLNILSEHLKQSSQDCTALKKQKENIAMIFQKQQALYPEWVYEAGFNPGLRSGFRFFLIHIERLIEIIFSLNYLTTEIISFEFSHLNALMAVSLQCNRELIDNLIDFFCKKTLPATSREFTQDVVELENHLREIVPGSLELLDMSSDYVTFTAMVRDIKDMRQILLELLLSLPAH